MIAGAQAQGMPPPGDARRGGFDNSVNVKKESDTVRRMLQEDGLASWRPDPSLLPPQACAAASMGDLLREVPVNGTAWLAFGNSGATEMLMNWAHWVLTLGFGNAMVVAAYDDSLFSRLRSLQIPAYNLSGALPEMHFRGTPFLFHRMGYLKAMTIMEVLISGRHVLTSDADVVWLRDPIAELERLAASGASLAASTDCINVADDRDKSTRPASAYLCGHAPGNKDGTVFNTGVIFMASRPAAIAFCRLWANRTLALREWWSDDQGVFNRLLTGRGTWPVEDNGYYPVKAAGMGGNLVHGPRGSGLILAPLPAERFCSGHLVWVQQAARPLQCASVHTTYTEFGDASKRWRLIEAGLWGPLPPSYFSDGHYLTFDPPQPGPDPAPCPLGEGVTSGKPCGGEDTAHGLGRKRPGNIPALEALKRSSRLSHNIELMRRQLWTIRDALAIARVLNRTLILPHFDCMCDRSELVDYVPSCVFPGAPPTLPFPFKCSTLFVLNVHKLLLILDPPSYGMKPSMFGGRTVPPIKLRAHSFLTDPRTRRDVTASVANVRLHGPRATPAARDLNCSAPHDRICDRERQAMPRAHDAEEALADVAADGALRLPRGASNLDVLRMLGSEEARRTRILRLSDAEGAFGGWDSNWEEGYLFKSLEKWFLLGGDWCCSSREANVGRLYPLDPPGLRMPARGGKW